MNRSRSPQKRKIHRGLQTSSRLIPDWFLPFQPIETTINTTSSPLLLSCSVKRSNMASSFARSMPGAARSLARTAANSQRNAVSVAARNVQPEGRRAFSALVNEMRRPQVNGVSHALRSTAGAVAVSNFFHPFFHLFCFWVVGVRRRWGKNPKVG